MGIFFTFNYKLMKYIALLVASANATAYTVCSFSQAFHADTDTDCSGAVAGTDTTKALVGLCTYSTTKTAWFAVTSCTTTTAAQQWHSTAECADSSPDAATLTTFTAVDTCLAGATTGS